MATVCYSVRCDFFYPFSRDLNTAYISIPLVTKKNQNKSILHVNFIYRISKLPGQSCVRCRSIPLVSASSQSYEDGALAQTGLTDGIGKHATSWTLELATQLELGGPTGRAPDARAGPSIDRIARVVAPPALFFLKEKQQTFIRQLDQHSRWLQCPKQALGSHQAKHKHYRMTPEKHPTGLVDTLNGYNPLDNTLYIKVQKKVTFLLP